MPLSPPPERVDTMHRQIAGKLTGPVTKWIVLVGVLVLLGIFGSLAGKLTDVQNNEAESWLPQSAESTQAIKRLEAFQDPNDLVTTVVYYRASGLTDEDLAAIESHGPEIADIEGVSNVITPQGAATAGIPAPYVSEDGQVAKLDFTINRGDALWEDMPDVADEIRDITAIHGVEVYVAGAGGTTADQAAAFAGMDGRLLLITLCAVILILLVSYRSPVLWALPIFCAVVSLGIAMGVLYLLAKYADMTINGQTQFIMTVLVIGAGTDYALLLVARYREELRRHEDRHEAMAFALHRAAPAIFASATTVVVGLLCLMFAELNSTAGLGPANAVAVAVTFLDHGDPAARAAGHLRPLGVLAVHPAVRHRGAHRVRLLGPHRQPDRAAAAQGLDHHHRPAAAGRARRPAPGHLGHPQRRDLRRRPRRRVGRGQRAPGRARAGRRQLPGPDRGERRPGRRGRRLAEGRSTASRTRWSPPRRTAPR